ncbi:RNA polymerase sigma factor [Nocardioides flavus (ex Wang et al. 2016)]|uniref:RNA polymerase sigma factor n=1 Tax=Nocardioides flavus (ex Wang et al. 2016) TaxID=2058780 RepID=A0ABQ3HGK9_9ACTN|nr:sigma-70 family RNA polymerase sigma factor [Nocardioides flavus (ex Wang et al. 2016)]GHE16401.1 RNA polymerase sigma factor [Nocardioides flavus (ex Wang et al. 2016)]
MTIIPFPARSPRRYGDRVVTEALTFADEQDDGVRALAARLVAGDEGALESIYDRWSALVHTYALRALHDQHDAEDVTQQVFVAAWRSRHTLTPSPSALPAWLLGIARHKVSDVRAARARDADRLAAVVSLPGAHDGVDPSVDEDVAERLVVRQAVDEMPDPRRTILFLAFWEERSHAEIAETVGLPLGTVKSHVRRGLMKLHQQLEGVRHGSR